MGEEIAFENGQYSDFQGLVTLTFDWVIQHTSYITHRPLPTYQVSLKSKKLLWTDGWTDGHWRPTLLGRFRDTVRILSVSNPKLGVLKPLQQCLNWDNVMSSIKNSNVNMTPCHSIATVGDHNNP